MFIGALDSFQESGIFKTARDGGMRKISAKCMPETASCYI